jgi:RimJ/RimL family protein N-acetyltransferase
MRGRLSILNVVENCGIIVTMLIETKRLSLRPLVDLDVQPLSLLFAQEAFTHYLALERMDVTGARLFASEFVFSSLSEFSHQHTGVMSVRRRKDDTFLGYAGLRPLPDRTSAMELTYAIAPAQWGAGLATEAAGAVIDWGLANISGLREIIALSRTENPASIRVMEKLGMKDQGKTDRYYGENLVLFSCGRDRDGCVQASLA